MVGVDGACAVDYAVGGVVAQLDERAFDGGDDVVCGDGGVCDMDTSGYV